MSSHRETMLRKSVEKINNWTVLGGKQVLLRIYNYAQGFWHTVRQSDSVGKPRWARNTCSWILQHAQTMLAFEGFQCLLVQIVLGHRHLALSKHVLETSCFMCQYCFLFGTCLGDLMTKAGGANKTFFKGFGLSSDKNSCKIRHWMGIYLGNSGFFEGPWFAIWQFGDGASIPRLAPHPSGWERRQKGCHSKGLPHDGC